MKLLLSAYACEPGKGSEPGVGWRWATELARSGHEVWVVTRGNNEQPVAESLACDPVHNLHFVYYDLPSWLTWWKKGGRGIRLYYFLWQIGIYFVARRLNNAVGFDRVHHITFVGIRQPSFMGLLGAPFVFGPAAGGERAPRLLRKSFPLKGRITEWLRDVANRATGFNPLMHLTFHTATEIFATCEETRQLIPARYRHKCRIGLAIGVDLPHPVPARPRLGSRRILFVGRLLYWKGAHLALRAVARLIANGNPARFTVIGDGPDRRRLQALAQDLGVADQVEWIPWLSQEKLLQAYAEYDVMLFPSLHDSGGMVVLEAMARGLPVVCLDLGGPGTIVNDVCGRVVATRSRNEAEVVADLADATETLLGNARALAGCSAAAPLRARQFSWASVVGQVYGGGTTGASMSGRRLPAMEKIRQLH
jgi:glycosyltransferase involved in cell wall biosynthesis